MQRFIGDGLNNYAPNQLNDHEKNQLFGYIEPRFHLCISGNHRDKDHRSIMEYFVGNESTPIRFVDLFAGLGGFHVGLSRVRGIKTKCVFASEINEQLLGTYKKNFPGLRPSSYAGDITAVSAEQIGKHEILCAGFP
ncbi:DNA cytosine methyltransferase, partial [bacterium]|nr:DNA cytosine methyltransferase [bacterium]